MTKRASFAAGIVALVLFVFTTGVLFAGGGLGRPPMMAAAAAPLTHEDMHRMMDAMHGEGTSERMHNAMGADAERLMAQCASMMTMMQQMQGMMGDSESGSMRGIVDIGRASGERAR